MQASGIMNPSPPPRLRSDEIPGVGVLLVSPNSRLHLELREKLRQPRWNFIEAFSGAEALEYLRESISEILLLDPLLPDLESGEFSTMVSERFPAVQILTVNSHTGQLVLGTSSPTALSAKLAETLYSEVSAHTPVQSNPALQLSHIRGDGSQKRLRGLVGDSEPMQRVYELTHLVAPRDTTVLVTGESGTGKDLIAQAIHLISARQTQPLVVINCAAIPEALLEAELFGYVKGSFTGAVQSRVGRIHAAHGGTLFLDEIAETSLEIQKKLLKVIREGVFQRLGGTRELRTSFKLICATNQNLDEMVANKTFREDLYYRIATFPVRVPSLR